MDADVGLQRQRVRGGSSTTGELGDPPLWSTDCERCPEMSTPISTIALIGSGLTAEGLEPALCTTISDPSRRFAIPLAI